MKIGVIVDLAPFSVQQHCHFNAGELKTYAHVRRVILDYIEAAADRADALVPMDVSALDRSNKGGRGSKRDNGGKGDKFGKVAGKTKKGEQGRKGDMDKKHTVKIDGNCSHCGK